MAGTRPTCPRSPGASPPRGGIHLDIIVPMTDDARDGLPWVQPVYGLFDGAVRELQRRVRQRDR